MFFFGDNVDRDTVDKVERAGDSRLSTNRRQIGDSRLCRQCVPGLSIAYEIYVAALGGERAAGTYRIDTSEPAIDL